MADPEEIDTVVISAMKKHIDEEPTPKTPIQLKTILYCVGAILTLVVGWLMGMLTFAVAIILVAPIPLYASIREKRPNTIDEFDSQSELLGELAFWIAVIGLFGLGYEFAGTNTPQFGTTLVERSHTIQTVNEGCHRLLGRDKHTTYKHTVWGRQANNYYGHWIWSEDSVDIRKEEVKEAFLPNEQCEAKRIAKIKQDRIRNAEYEKKQAKIKKAWRYKKFRYRDGYNADTRRYEYLTVAYNKITKQYKATNDVIGLPKAALDILYGNYDVTWYRKFGNKTMECGYSRPFIKNDGVYAPHPHNCPDDAVWTYYSGDTNPFGDCDTNGKSDKIKAAVQSVKNKINYYLE
jgi:hypothetical protein